MTQYAYKDNAVGRLASPLDSVDLTAVLEAGQGANFPTVSVAVPAILTVVQYSVPTDPSSTVVYYEKIKVTVKSTDTLTITERGVGDTSAHDFNAGDYVYLNITEDFVNGIYTDFVRSLGLASSVITGSINPTASTSVTGVGTLFTTELQVGDRITVSGETRTVTVITSNTALTVDVAFSDNANDTSVDKLPAIAIIKKSSGVDSIYINDLGHMGIGIPNPDSYNAYGNNFVVGNIAGSAGISIVAKSDGFSSIYLSDSLGNVTQGLIEYSHTADTLTICCAGVAGLVFGASGYISNNPMFGNSGTAVRYLAFTNTGNASYIGIEGSGGGQILGGTSPYFFVIGTGGNNPVEICSYTTPRIRIAGGGTITINGSINFAVDAQASDTYVITLDPAPTAYFTGMPVIFKAKTANTTACTINVNGLGAKSIVKAVSTALATNDILANMFCLLIYDGTNFVLMNPRAL